MNNFNKNWTTREVETFVQVMVKEIEGGRRPGKSGFQIATFNKMAEEMGRKLGDVYDAARLINKHKALKSRYSSIMKLLNVTGFGWCPLSKTVVAEPLVWEDYLKVNPDARHFRNKPLPDLEMLDKIFGNSVATGGGVVASGDEPESVNTQGGSSKDVAHDNDIEDTCDSDSPMAKRSRSEDTSSRSTSKALGKAPLILVAESIIKSSETFKETLQSFDPVMKKRKDQGEFQNILNVMLDKREITTDLYEFAMFIVMENAEQIAVFLLQEAERRVSYLKLLQRKIGDRAI